MAITISEVKTPRELKEFIALPAKIHKYHKEWIPSLLNDDKAIFTPHRNEAFQYCSTLRLLARLDNQVVGRIMGIVHHHYNDANNEQNARFSFIETYENKQVFNALIHAVEEWAKKQGCKKLVGPLGFSDKDPQGFLIEGFDQQTMMVTNCNFPYMNQFISGLGYTPHTILVEYKLPLTDQMMERIAPFAKRASKNPNIKLQTFTSTRQIKPHIRPVFELINRTYKNIYGFSPLSMQEADEFANRYLSFLNPSLVKVVTNQKNQIIAFLVAMSDFSKGIKKARGRVFPWGWIPILHSMKTSDTVVLFLGAIDEDYRNKGIDALMANSFLDDARRLGYRYLDSHLIMERNTKMRNEIERLEGSTLYKRYCIYQKDLL
jgi:GNAT superfamily N-acetyltransferase